MVEKAVLHTTGMMNNIHINRKNIDRLLIHEHKIDDTEFTSRPKWIKE